ncbi:integral membrane protein GPR155-like, partial [Stegodyphus dumicola]|uniref:integral membrane protein GPR155-like n=1 Tax=Stegodyphus dumicola TaxID=202533 RepID=UPI0015AFF753
MNFTNSSSDVLGEVDPYPFEKFAPTLTQCFILTIVGYVTAKFELISASDMRGIGVFATYFGLPGIVWDTLADSDFSDFYWELIIGLLLGKLLIFAVVCGFCLLLTGNIGLAGLVALYCVHSNDLPVGCPLMSSLYKDFRSHMMKYLFLMPSMTTIFIIPIGNYMTEYYKYKRKQVSQQETKDSEQWIKRLPRKKMIKLIKDVIKSPIVIATLTGILLNLIFKGKVPPVLHQPIHVVAATIPGLVLIILGFNMVRKDRHLISSAVVYAILLVVIKMIVTPLVLHIMVRAVTTHCNSSLFLSDFALLYGILPPSTAVFLSGLEFRKPLASMGAALIICSFASYPLSYVVARFTIAAKHELNYYVPQLQYCLIWMACINIACNIFTWTLIMWRKQWNKVPCCYVMCLIFSQVN